MKKLGRFSRFRNRAKPQVRRAEDEESVDKKEKAKELKDPLPGGLPVTLRRRMGDDMADMFDEAGLELYADTVESLKEVLREKFETYIPRLDENLKEEGGERWRRAAAEFYRPWINAMVETIVTQGMNEASGALEDVATTFAAEQSTSPDAAEEEGLLEVPVEETEEVLEVEDEDIEEAGGEDALELEELFAESVTGLKSRRKRRLNRVFKVNSSYLTHGYGEEDLKIMKDLGRTPLSEEVVDSDSERIEAFKNTLNRSENNRLKRESRQASRTPRRSPTRYLELKPQDYSYV